MCMEPCLAVLRARRTIRIDPVQRSSRWATTWQWILQEKGRQRFWWQNDRMHLCSNASDRQRKIQTSWTDWFQNSSEAEVLWGVGGSCGHTGFRRVGGIFWRISNIFWRLGNTTIQHRIFVEKTNKKKGLAWRAVRERCFTASLCFV